MILCQKLEQDVASHLRKKHNSKRLTKAQKEVSEQITNIIVANESPEDWNSKIEKYCSDPKDHNKKQLQKIEKIAYEHQIDTYLASILYLSKV